MAVTSLATFLRRPRRASTLIGKERYGGWFNDMLGYLDAIVIDSAVPVALNELLHTCRSYAGDRQEVVQLVWHAQRTCC